MKNDTSTPNWSILNAIETTSVKMSRILATLGDQPYILFNNIEIAFKEVESIKGRDENLEELRMLLSDIYYLLADVIESSNKAHILASVICGKKIEENPCKDNIDEIIAKNYSLSPMINADIYKRLKELIDQKKLCL